MMKPSRLIPLTIGAILLVALSFWLLTKLPTPGLPMMVAPEETKGDTDYRRGESSPGYAMPEIGMDDQVSSNGSIGMMPPYFPEPSPTGGVTAADADQKIIKNGYLDLVVEDVSATLSKVRTYASGLGGYEQTSSISEREDGTKAGSISIRVPADQFEAAMNELKTYATLVQTETTNGQDVTEEYTDLEAQLESAEAQRVQYLEILERATTVEEILMVRPYLDQVQSTIMYLEGRIQYLANLTTYSTITVALAEEPSVRLPTKEFRLDTIVSQATQALIDLVQSFAIIAIWFVIVGGGIALPVGLLVWILMVVGMKLMRRK